MVWMCLLCSEILQLEGIQKKLNSSALKQKQNSYSPKSNPLRLFKNKQEVTLQVTAFIHLQESFRKCHKGPFLGSALL